MSRLVSALSGGTLNEADVAAAAQLACLLEVSAPKPGNVSPGRHFGDTRYEDFLASAVATGQAIGEGDAPVGAVVLRAVAATRRWTATNTNLGIVLLFAPLAVAARLPLALDTGVAVQDRPARLRAAVNDVLARTTVADASDVYEAIRRAAPGGLGTAASQDVAGVPTVTLREAMQLAADRDGIAREYVTAFETTFTIGVPTLMRARGDGLAWDDAVVETFLMLVAASPDTHIARRAGLARAEEVSRLASDVVEAGGVRTRNGRAAIAHLDACLRDARNASNPGTSADLTAAAIFASLICGIWNASPGA